MNIFKRKIYEKIKDWKESSQGRTALLIEGPRRVGKSTIVRAFAEEQYESFLFIDFSVCPSRIRKLFDDPSDLDYLFLQLQTEYNVVLKPRKSLLVFDEIQFCPKARQAIKHLVSDRRYDYIETGSLISIHKNVKDIPIPSEEKKIYMYPMDYEEFCWACGDMNHVPFLRQFFNQKLPLGAAHRNAMRLFRLYMLVGGMPQAVAAYLEHNNFQVVDEVKREIISLYEDDFHKIDTTGQLSMLFDSIPGELAKNSFRYQVSTVLKGKRADDILGFIAELVDSRTVLVSYHANEPNPMRSMTKDIRRFKLFTADTGLFVTLAFKDRDFTENVLYKKLLSDKLPANLGYLYENAVVQTLASAGNQLFYYTFPNDKRKTSYEIDFLLSRQGKLVPLEVKSSGDKTHSSLDVFGKRYSRYVGQKYLIYTKDFARDGEVICLPIYMTQFL